MSFYIILFVCCTIITFFFIERRKCTFSSQLFCECVFICQILDIFLRGAVHLVRSCGLYGITLKNNNCPKRKKCRPQPRRFSIQFWSTSGRSISGNSHRFCPRGMLCLLKKKKNRSHYCRHMAITCCLHTENLDVIMSGPLSPSHQCLIACDL